MKKDSKATDELNWKGEPRKRKQKVTIDLGELERLAQLHITNIEIAQWLNVNVKTLNAERYLSVINKAKSETKQKLKQKALQRALNDSSDSMLMFCLKNYCGWSNNETQTQETKVIKDKQGFTIKVKNTDTTNKD